MSIKDQSGPHAVDNPSHVEDLAAPIIYADMCIGGGPMHGDNITLTFSVKILDHRQNPPGTGDKTVLRLVLPRRSAWDMATFVQKFLTDLEAGSGAAAHATIN